MILALAVSGLLRAYSSAGVPQLVFTLSGDATSFRVDAASYGLSPSCVPRGANFFCTVPFLSYTDKQITPHSVIACKSNGAVCGGTTKETNVVCTCTPTGVDCPGDLFPEPVLLTPINLTAVAVSDSEIDLTWSGLSCNATGYRIERAPSPSGPWAEIGRVP